MGSLTLCRTTSVAVAVLPVPPFTELTATALTKSPATSGFTCTVMTHALPPVIAPSVTTMLLLPGEAVMVGELHSGEAAALLGDATFNPVGNALFNPTLVAASAAFVLVMV